MIRGLDITADYQQYPWKKIDWPALKADPLNFRFIWIKIGEGTDDNGYVEGAAGCVVGAMSVGFEAVNPYHFYLYQWFSTVANRWYVLSAKDQAKAFYTAAKAAGFPAGHPMTDLEDPLIGKFLLWSNTAEINLAIAFARKLAAHIKIYLEEITRLFGMKPDNYSGKWWLDKFVPLLINNGYGSEVAFLAGYNWILADYDGTLNIPDYLPAEKIIAWQETSSPVPSVYGIPTGRVVPGDALDIDRWMLSDEKFLEWSGQQEVPTMPAVIYNQNVSQAARAKILTLEGNQKITVPAVELGIDAVILPMGSMHNWDGSHWKVQTESTFSGRHAQFSAANIPVLGRFDLDAGSLIAEQHTSPEFENRAIRDNWILPYLLNAWHIGAWTWETVLGKQGKWRNLPAIIIRMTETDGWPKGTQVGGDWQKRIFDYVVYHLKYLMDNDMAPKVPIILYTGMWWLNLYPTFMGVELQNDKTWLYLQLGQWVNTSTAIFNILADVFAFPPADTFKFSSYPDNYFERILMHEFTGEAQKVKTITDAAGIPSPINLSLWQDTPAAMLAFLKYAPVVETPPVDPQIEVLKAQIAELEAQLAASQKSNGEWITWFAGAPGVG